VTLAPGLLFILCGVFVVLFAHGRQRLVSRTGQQGRKQNVVDIQAELALTLKAKPWLNPEVDSFWYVWGKGVSVTSKMTNLPCTYIESLFTVMDEGDGPLFVSMGVSIGWGYIRPEDIVRAVEVKIVPISGEAT